MKTKNWMVYFRNSDGCREGTESIRANSREEALRLYRFFFNVPSEIKCKAIPIIDKDFTAGLR